MDLQSIPFSHSGTYPQKLYNPQSDSRTNILKSKTNKPLLMVAITRIGKQLQPALSKEQTLKGSLILIQRSGQERTPLLETRLNCSPAGIVSPFALYLEPMEGVKPPTIRLQVECSIT